MMANPSTPCLMLAPPLAEAISPQPREVVFIIDTSGSMEGTSIEQARAALNLGLQFLGPDDRFNLVRFSSDSEKLFDESVPVYPAYLEQATDFIENLSANGGTVMAPALSMALNLPEQDGLLRQVVFVTDGSVGNEQELLLQIGRAVARQPPVHGIHRLGAQFLVHAQVCGNWPRQPHTHRKAR